MPEMSDLRDRIANAIARVPASKAADEVLRKIGKTHTLEPIPVMIQCPDCDGKGFRPECEAHEGYEGGYHQVGESRCGRCGGDGIAEAYEDGT